MCGYCFERIYLEDYWQRALKQEDVDVVSLKQDSDGDAWQSAQDFFIQEQSSLCLPSLTSDSYLILMAKWLAAFRTRAMSVEVLEDLLINPLPTSSFNAPTITLIDELRSTSCEIQTDPAIPKVLKPFYDPDEWLKDMGQMVHRMNEPEFSKGTYEMLDGYRQNFLEGPTEECPYYFGYFLPLLFLSLVDQIEVAPDTTLLQTIAYRNSSSGGGVLFNAPDLWLQRTAFVHCIKYYGLELVLKQFIEQDGRVILLWYSVMKLNMSKPDVELTIQTLQQNPQLYENEFYADKYLESYIEAVSAFVDSRKNK